MPRIKPDTTPEVDTPAAVAADADALESVDELFVDAEPARVSNNVLDEPEVAKVTTVGDDPQPGEFVGLGVEFLSVAAGDFIVDPETGCIVGAA